MPSDFPLRPLDDRLVIEPFEPARQTPGGIVLPDVAKQKPQRGRVVGTGPGKLLADGKRAALEVKIGDEVIFNRYAGSDVEVGRKEYKVLREEEVLAVVEKE
jgi:chaperonin GroES